MDTGARPFGFWTATALVVGGMIGSGIFLMPSALAPFGWTGVAAWFVSIGGALAIAWTLGRLARSMPEATGAVAVAGAMLGPLPGVLIDWSYWVAVWSANAAIAVAATSYLAAVWPALAATPLTGAVVAVALIWTLTLLNLAGAKRAGEFQVATTVLKLLPLLAVVVIALSLGPAGIAAAPPIPAPRALLVDAGERAGTGERQRDAGQRVHLRRDPVDVRDAVAVPRDPRRRAGPAGRDSHGGDRPAVHPVRILWRGSRSDRPQPRPDADGRAAVVGALMRRGRTTGLARRGP